MDGRGLLRAVKWFGSGRGPGGGRPVWPFAPGAGTSGAGTSGAAEAEAGAGSAAGGGERARVPGEVTGAESSAGGGVVRFARSELRVVVTAGGAVFCGWDGAAPGPSSALAGPPPQPDPRTSLEPDMDGGWRVVAERMTVAVSRTGAVEYRTPGGVVLRRDLPPRWWERAGAGGGPARWLVRSEIAPDARVFGLGGRSDGPRVRETPVVLGNAEPGGAAGGAVMPVHLVVADAGTHLAFHDTGWHGRVTVREGEEGAGSGHDRPGSVEWRMDGGPLRSWLLVGGPARVLDGFARLTGRASLPPVWALGRHHAPGGPVGERELRGLLAGWAERGVVPSAVHVGADEGVGAAGADRSPSRVSASGGTASASGEVAAVSGDVTEGPPDLPALAKSLGEDGVRLVRTAASGAPTGDEWGAWCEALPAQGFSGVFRDRSAGRADGVRHFPAPGRVVDAAQGRDGLSSARAAYAGLRASRPGERPFVVTYDGRVGAQRYGAVWCGDGAAGWPGLRAGLAQVLGLGLCGVPFAGLDTVADGTVEDAELALRRLQLAAFLPLLRTGRGDASESVDGEAVLRERERLRPYLLSLACLARWTGAPVVRPLWWGSPRDRRLRECEDAFLLGDALLVAPVLEPGCARREVRLPRGRWYDTATGAVHEGPGRALVDAPRGRVPVLARAGSVLAVRGADGGAELEVWAPAEGRTGGGLVVREAGDGWVRPRAERLVTRWEGGAVVVERVAGEERVPARGPVRVRGLE